MSILTKAKKLSIICLNPHIITCKSKYLFLLSHMRSRSSVLSHVLGSNPGICGYSELHSSYINYIDLVNMRIKLYKDLECKLKHQYLFDKILQNRHVVSNRILEITNPKIIFLLRNSESTIKSIINMAQITGARWCEKPEDALEYYCSRLLCLEKYANEIKGNYFFIESDDLVDNTDHVLDDLSKWLSLHNPLEKSYSTFSNTGKPGFGDPLHNIKSGVIKKTESYKDIDVPLEILQKGNASYERCKSNILKHCCPKQDRIEK